MRRLLACLGLAASLLACAGPKVDTPVESAGAPRARACDVGPGGTSLADDPASAVPGSRPIRRRYRWRRATEASAAPASTRMKVHGGDGRLALGALRAGLAVAVTASATPDGKAWPARDIAVVHEVSGPVDAVTQDGGQLVVADQTILVTQSTWGVAGPKPGDLVAVSGLRNEAGRIVATRIDPRLPGDVAVRRHTTAVLF